MALRQPPRGVWHDISRWWRNTFQGVTVSLRRTAIVIAVVVFVVSIGHVIWPQIDIKMLGVQTDQSFGHLTVSYFELENGSYLDLKDLEIACEMKGSSGTTIKTESKTIYEVLESGSKRSFSLADMGSVPEQATQFPLLCKERIH